MEYWEIPLMSMCEEANHVAHAATAEFLHDKCRGLYYNLQYPVWLCKCTCHTTRFFKCLGCGSDEREIDVTNGKCLDIHFCQAAQRQQVRDYFLARGYSLEELTAKSSGGFVIDTWLTPGFCECCGEPSKEKFLMRHERKLRRDLFAENSAHTLAEMALRGWLDGAFLANADKEEMGYVKHFQQQSPDTQQQWLVETIAERVAEYATSKTS